MCIVEDPDYLIANDYGMLDAYNDVDRNIRGVFFINPENTISAFYFYPNEVGRNIDEIKRTLVALQVNYNDSRALLPANWTPGEYYNKKIPPLALQMLVGNAIKHNIISSEFPLFISINSYDGGFLTIKNNLQKKNNRNLSNGIGLQNIKNRYDFLSDSKVEISETSQFFEVKLPLLKG